MLTELHWPLWISAKSPASAYRHDLQRLTWCLMGPKLTPSEARCHLVSDAPVQGPSTTFVPDLRTQVDVPVTLISPAQREGQGQGRGEKLQGPVTSNVDTARVRDACRRHGDAAALCDGASRCSCSTCFQPHASHQAGADSMIFVRAAAACPSVLALFAVTFHDWYSTRGGLA